MQIDSKTRVEIGQLNDQNLMTVSWLVSRYHPFNNYSFGLMLDKLYEQLATRNNLMIINNDRLVAYVGWILCEDEVAREWFTSKSSEVPLHNSNGNSGLITVFVCEHRDNLMLMGRSLSHIFSGRKVYRKRLFQNGKPESFRAPIKGRPQIKPT